MGSAATVFWGLYVSKRKPKPGLDVTLLQLGIFAYQRTEVTTHTTDLLLKDLVVESRLEFTLSRRSGGDIHGGLTTTEDDKVFLGCDSSTVQRGVCRVGLEHLEVAGRDEFGGLVLAGGDEVGPVGRPLEVGDLAAELVGGNAVNNIAVLAVELRDTAVLVAGDDVLGHVAPAGDGGLALVADDA